MSTTLNLQFGEVLTTEEMRELVQLAIEDDRPLERLVFESARELVRRRRAPSPPPGAPALSSPSLPASPAAA